MFEASPYRRVLCYFPRYRWPLVGGALCVVASRVLLVATPLWLRDALRILEAGGQDTIERATAAVWMFLVFGVAAGLFTWAQRWLLISTSRKVERDLKRDIFAHVERLPVATFDRVRTGDLLSRLTSDVEAVRFVVGPGPMFVSGTLVLFPLALVVMLGISVPVTLAALVPLLSIAFVVRGLGPGIMRLSRAVQDRIGDLAARAQESFAGARIVRAYATEDIEIEAFARKNRALVTETLGLARRRAVLTASVYALGGLAQLVVLVYGGFRMLAGDFGFGDMGAFLAYMGMLVWPMISVGWVVSALQRAAAAIQRIDEVMRKAPERSVLVEPAVEEAALEGAIRIEHLTFSYPDTERTALENVSLSIAAGGTLALVGPVGSGKSTVLALLTRTYDPPPGTVFLDGTDIARIPLARLRKAFAAVPQDAFLFSDTIRGNLGYGVEGDLTPERARAAVTAAGLETDIQAFPHELVTVVGERGITLSGGQKQRLTLARALLRPAPILLLDDALSSVDTHTEARILARLGDATEQRTVVVVAHRLSTVRGADRIVVLEDGRVTEAGSHDELLDRGGWYARTYVHQRLEAELEDLG